MIGNATWTLIGHDDKRTALTSGSARAIDGFNIFDSQYFAADLENEAVQRRIAENMADADRDPARRLVPPAGGEAGQRADEASAGSGSRRSCVIPGPAGSCCCMAKTPA